MSFAQRLVCIESGKTLSIDVQWFIGLVALQPTHTNTCLYHMALLMALPSIGIVDIISEEVVMKATPVVNESISALQNLTKSTSHLHL